jgi:hypothetical protein
MLLNEDFEVAEDEVEVEFLDVWWLPVALTVAMSPVMGSNRWYGFMLRRRLCVLDKGESE